MITTFNDPARFKAFFNANLSAIKQIAIKEHREMAGDIKTSHKSLTSGGISTKQLKELGHPFSRRRWKALDPMIKRASRKRRHGVGHVPLLPINRQTGKLQKSLKMKHTAYPQTLSVSIIEFDTPYAKFVLGEKGTRKMIPRGFVRAVKKIFKRREQIMKQKFRYQIVQLRGRIISGGKI